MLIAVITLTIYLTLGILILTDKDDPTPFDFGCMWLSLILVLTKNLLDTM